MTSKPRFSGSDQPKKYKLKPEEPRSDQFTNLFGEFECLPINSVFSYILLSDFLLGTPITKTSRAPEVPKIKDPSKPIVKPNDKDKGDKISGMLKKLFGLIIMIIVLLFQIKIKVKRKVLTKIRIGTKTRIEKNPKIKIRKNRLKTVIVIGNRKMTRKRKGTRRTESTARRIKRIEEIAIRKRREIKARFQGRKVQVLKG